MCIGSFFFAGGLFVFAWTANPEITWVAPCVGGVMAGVGFFTIFQAALNYLLDTFQRYGASASESAQIHSRRNCGLSY